MKTTKPISTISYNSHAFLRGTLERLKKSHKIAFWVFIRHEPEEDEKKAHFHVYIEPNGKVDTEALRDLFQEIDRDNFDKPLGVLPFKSSKFADWYWYGIHDKAYLLSKGETRKHHYKMENMITDEEEYLYQSVKENPCPQSDVMRIAEMISKGWNELEIASAIGARANQLGFVISSIRGISENLGMLTNRGDRKNHEREDRIIENAQERKIEE